MNVEAIAKACKARFSDTVNFIEVIKEPQSDIEAANIKDVIYPGARVYVYKGENKIVFMNDKRERFTVK